MIWILDKNQGLAFEWNESQTVNVYDMDVTQIGPYREILCIQTAPTKDCYEFAEKVTFEEFKESAERWVG